MKNHKINLINKLILAISIIAIIITIVLIINLSKDYSLFSGHFKIQETGNVGDFFGGVVGSLIGLISVLLLYKTLRYQQTDIENNEISTRLQWTTDLILKLLDDLKLKDCYTKILSLKDDLGNSDVGLRFIRENIEMLNLETSKLDLEFRVINKLVYQEKFDVSEINLLRLIIYNSLEFKFFKFLNSIKEFVNDGNQLSLINNETDLRPKIEDIRRYLERISVNSSYRNQTEIMSIINNYRAEDNLQEIRLNDWLKMTGKIR